ncbi:two-component regulator propeller domain-containing protein [Ekhidna sp.]|uniref:two-component regulator propeller domain-containing protein n=3 Tax=Ekhidna sp. TaxID=2608089 RepID=UPI00329A463D
MAINKAIRSLLMIVCILSASLANSQDFSVAPSFTFESFFKSDGLNQSSTNKIFQDSEDMVWIANFGGINRFDGYDFESFTHQFGDSTTIPDNSVWTFFEDNSNRLWVGTKASLSLFNRSSNSFENYILKEGASTLAIKTIVETEREKLLVGTEGDGIYEFDAKTKVFKKISAFPNSKVMDIEIDPNGYLWVATEDKGVFRWNQKHSKAEKVLAAINSAWDILVDSNGNIWLGTDENGLWFKEKNEDSFQEIKNLHPSYRAGDRIKSVTEAKDGKIWIGSATEGISIFDPDQRFFHHYLHDPNTQFSISDNDVSTVFHGSNGVTYVGYYMKGFQKLVRSPFHFIKNNPGDEGSLSNNNVYCMYRDKSDNLWMGTFGGGLNLMESNNPAKFKRYVHDPDNPQSVSHNWIRILYEDSKGRFWVGTWGGGLNIFDRNNGIFKRYKSSLYGNKLSMNIITAIFEDSKGTIWIGTYGEGINIYQPETDDFKHIRSIPGDTTSLSDNHITSFIEDESGLWVCTYGGGLNRYNYDTKTFESFVPDAKKKSSLNNFKVLHLYPDGDNYWLTTLGGGLNYFNPASKSFSHWTESDGLSNNSTMGMLKTKAGTYWISTNNGLSHFNPVNNSFKNYTMKDGLGSDDYNLEAYMEDTDGYFYFGGKNGITFFNPNEVKVQATFPRLVLRNILIEDRKHESLEKEIVLPYDQRLTFQFAAINPARKSNVSYSYMLDDDQNWHQLNNQNSLEFFALDHGSHILKVRSTNSDKIWNPDAITINFFIPPPWYETWTFRISSILLILLVGILYYKSRVNALKRNQLILEKKVADRTNTIAQKNKDLQKAYNKQKELEHFKESMVSMIAHDLKNPLVSIIRRADRDKNDDIKQIDRSGKHMLNLIENMLDVLRFEKSKMKLDITDFEISETINEVIDELKPVAEERNIQIMNKMNRKYRVQADQQLIHRVLNNLISNAIKYSHFNSPVEIQTSESIAGIKVSVKDYGDGIPTQDLKKIFEQFEQSEARSFGGASSTGLGLSFCKLAIHAHGQKMEVDSTKGKGSVFSFTLPIVSKGASMISDQLNDQTFFNFKDEDYLVWEGIAGKINELEVYEAGKWSELVDSLLEKSSSTKSICDQLMQLVTEYDQNGIAVFKQKLAEFLTTTSAHESN